MALQDYDFKKIGLFISVILIVVGGIIGAGTGIYYFRKFKDTEKRFREASIANPANEDAKTLIAKVGKLIKLPEGETPTIATVADLAKLQSQPFFAKAKVGDKVLLFMQAKKAFLYDPVNNVIVEVGPLIIPTTTPGLANASASGSVAGLATSVTPAPVVTKVSVYNGTPTSGLTDKFAAELLAKITNINVVQKTNASKKDYAKSVIIDMTSKNQTVVENIAKELNLSVSALPADEKTPTNADILIILGTDRN